MARTMVICPDTKKNLTMGKQNLKKAIKNEKTKAVASINWKII